MVTPISSHVKDKNSIFTARDEDNYDFSGKGKILVFHQYLYNKCTLFPELRRHYCRLDCSKLFCTKVRDFLAIKC